MIDENQLMQMMGNHGNTERREPATDEDIEHAKFDAKRTYLRSRQDLAEKILLSLLESRCPESRDERDALVAKAVSTADELFVACIKMSIPIVVQNDIKANIARGVEKYNRDAEAHNAKLGMVDRTEKRVN